MSMRTYLVKVTLKTGLVIERKKQAPSAAAALGLVCDQEFGLAEPAFSAVSVTQVGAGASAEKAASPRRSAKKSPPARKTSPTSLEDEKAATKAVKRLMDQGIPHELCGIGVVEAYAVGVAEAARLDRLGRQSN